MNPPVFIHDGLLGIRACHQGAAGVGRTREGNALSEALVPGPEQGAAEGAGELSVFGHGLGQPCRVIIELWGRFRGSGPIDLGHHTVALIGSVLCLQEEAVGALPESIGKSTGGNARQERSDDSAVESERLDAAVGKPLVQSQRGLAQHIRFARGGNRQQGGEQMTLVISPDQARARQTTGESARLQVPLQ